MVHVGEIADYVDWLGELFPDATTVPTREAVWELMAERVTDLPIRGIEFGVAWGYGTGWWLKRLPSSQLRWDGFDRFTGLPREWRGMRAGSFDAQGKTPPIDDPRVTWHVGDVEDRVGGLHLNRDDPCQLIVLFDLDIFEPTLTAWSHLRGLLRPGDILYFDEAFDSDERRLLVEYVLPSGTYKFVGASPLALAVEVVATDAA
jgi:hypothetical protein